MSSKLTTCKGCGHEIANNAKTCPHCGAKSKKPIFKKWWFWAIVAILAILIGSAGNDGEKTSDNNKIESTMFSSDASVSTTEDVGQNTTASKATEESKETEATVKETEQKNEMTIAQKNALASAKAYISFSAFSYEGLISQLEFEKYSREDAVFAADNCGADWFEQALKSAKNYLSFSAFSHKGLIKQLEFEKFTTEQATHAADNCGADWFEQAAKSAKNYLNFSSFSKEGLIGQLEFEGFTREQAEYGVKANGYE